MTFKGWKRGTIALPALLVAGMLLWPAVGHVHAQQRRDPVVPTRTDAVEIAVRTVALETPSVDKDGNVYFNLGFFVRSLPRYLMKFDTEGQTTVFRANYKGGATGWDSENRMLALSDINGHEGLTREDLKTGKVEILAENFQGKEFRGLNDFTQDGKGRVYMTERANRAVYRIDGPGKVEKILGEADLQEPNGITISPDDKTLYVVESAQGKGMNRRINAYDLSPDGKASKMRVFHDFRPGRSADGISMDVQGNVYAAAGLNFESSLHIRPNREAADETMDTKGGVYVLSPDGKLKRFIPVPEDHLTNLTFGDKDLMTLYITAGKALFKIKNDVKGLPR